MSWDLQRVKSFHAAQARAEKAIDDRNGTNASIEIHETGVKLIGLSVRIEDNNGRDDYLGCYFDLETLRAMCAYLIGLAAEVDIKDG